MIGVVICRKLFLPVLALLTLVLFVSGCSFGDDNVGAISDPAAAPASAPQVPESMKTNDFGNGAQPPPQGL
jgi:outer membrane lipoprotein-sorting protein